MNNVRRAAAAVAVAALALGMSGMGTASSPKAAHPRAVLDRNLRHSMTRAVAAGKAPALQVIVTGWDKASLGVLDKIGVKHRHLQALPMAFAKLTPEQIVKVLNAKNVRSVYAERRYRLTMNEAGPLIGARHVADKLKVTGAGSVIAVIDTGIDTTHPDLDGDKVVKNYEVIAPNVNEPGAPLLVENPMSDDDEHGSHVSGTIAGTGEVAQTDAAYEGLDLRGVAPGAKLIGYSANQGATLLSTHTIAAFDHIIATRAQTGVRAISNSWGGSDGADYDPNDAISVAQKAAWDAGIVPVFAAGNSGNPGDVAGDGLNTLSSQCVSPWVVCVAAMTKHRQVVTFSSKGRPNGNVDRAIAQRYNIGLYRPSVTAPGVNITAPAAISSSDGDKPHGYLTISGTSMSTPVVSGVIALMTSANPKLTPSQIVRILESTADPLPGWAAYEDGAGAANARKAVEAALAMKAGRTAALRAPQLSYAPPAVTGKVLGDFDGTALPASYVHGQGVTTHTFTVPPGTERFDLELSWDTQAQNLYAFLWEPGVTPNDADPSGAPFASQESWGLLCDGVSPVMPCLLEGRRAAVRYPKAGTWSLRVFGRTAAIAYNAVVTASTFKLPTTTASLAGGVLSGSATFPAADTHGAETAGLTGTSLSTKNPTEKPLRVYFHDNLPLAGATIESPTWDQTKPVEDTPKTWQGVAGGFLGEIGVLERPFFEGIAPADMQGTLVATIWAGSDGQLDGFFGQWDVLIYRGEEEEPFAQGSVSNVGLSEVPTEISIPVTGFEVKKGTPLKIVFNAPYVDVDAHYAMYFDSVDMPSGVSFPSVTKFIAKGVLEVTDAVLTDLQGAGGAVLSWSRVEGASAYRVYSGDSPASLRPVARVAQPPKPSAKAAAVKPPLVVTGDLTVGQPGNGLAIGVTEAEFLLTCPDTPASQGIDGYVFPIPPESRDGKQKITVKGDGAVPYDLDVHLFDAECVKMTGHEDDLATTDPDETGTIPAGAAYVLVAEYLGGPMSFTATVTRGGAVAAAGGPAKVKRTISGLLADRPAYFRVAAIDKAGREGPQTELFVTVPSAFRRSVEVSTDGRTWRTVKVAPNGSWSVPVSAVLSGVSAAAGSTVSVQVRARAGDAVGPAKTVTASGVFRPVGGGGGNLPATGVGGGALGLALVALAAALAVRARRRLPV